MKKKEIIKVKVWNGNKYIYVPVYTENECISTILYVIDSSIRNCTDNLNEIKNFTTKTNVFWYLYMKSSTEIKKYIMKKFTKYFSEIIIMDTIGEEATMYGFNLLAYSNDAICEMVNILSNN